MAERLRSIYGLIFALSIPVLLITTNLRYVASEVRVYETGFQKYRVAEVTGIAPGELKRVAQELIEYFGSDRELYQTQVTIEGEKQDLFTEREVRHLKDVKGLLVRGRQIWIGTLVITFGYVAFLFVRWRSRAWPALAWAVAGGSGLTLFSGLALILALALGFDWLFLQFHYVSFSNDLWQLSCPWDLLACLFTPGFFYDAARLLVGAVAVEAIIMGAIAGGYLWWRKAKAGPMNRPPSSHRWRS